MNSNLFQPHHRMTTSTAVSSRIARNCIYAVGDYASRLFKCVTLTTRYRSVGRVRVTETVIRKKKLMSQYAFHG